MVDANVFVGASVRDDQHHLQGLAYSRGIEAGNYQFHRPALAIVEIVGAVSRRVGGRHFSAVTALSYRLRDWIGRGRILLYDLDRTRMEYATTMALRYRLKGANAVYAGLAEELSLPLITFDNKLAARYPGASQ